MTAAANELRDQGVRLFDQRDYEASARLFHQAMDQYAEQGDEDMVAEMKVNIALVHNRLEENSTALDLMQEALRHFQNTGDRLRTAQVLGNLGAVYRALNDKERAHEAYRQAVDIFKELEETELYSQTLLAMARMQLSEGRIFEGATTYRIGIEGVRNPTASQKIIKSLSDIINRLGGARTP